MSTLLSIRCLGVLVVVLLYIGAKSMAEGKNYQAVAVAVEDEQTVDSSDGATEEAPKQESERQGRENIQEDIALTEVGGRKDGATDSGRPAIKKGSLLKRVSWEWDEYDDIKRKVTAKALMNDEENPLLLAIKVTEKLHERAAKKEPNEDDFIDLANHVEEFTLRFLDPLKDQKRWREDFALNPETDVILETAIKLEQKKFFDHPIIIGIMNERWHGDRRIAFVASRPFLWWLFLNLWCLIDIVFFPISFFLAFVAGWIAARVMCIRSLFQRRLFFLRDDEVKSTSIYKRYKDFFTLPYFIFVRDTLSYLALLGLHLVICVEPSQLKFSSLEWAILVFLFGRLLVEIKQIAHLTRSEGRNRKAKALRSYFRDRWNLFDFATIFIFFIAILPLRIVTWVKSDSVTNNRALEIAGTLYGVNAMLLTLRAFGSILETFEGVGTIQIALFHIIRDAVVVVIHFGAITLAFSSTITKLFVAETSMVEGDTDKYPMCNETGILCWWRITTHLGLSVLDLSDGLDFFKSADSFSRTLAHLLFAVYLVMILILLINMLIALLSNTYQRVQDNSRKEWAFQKAVIIQTYSNYHPIPVPFNIISTIVTCFCGFGKKEADETERKRRQHDLLNHVVEHLQHKYILKYGDSFPPIYKLDQVLEETENTESMVNQVLHRIFTNQQGCDKALLPTGPTAWETSRYIFVEGYLLTTTNYGMARYRTAFSHRFPHFEVMILEGGVTKWLALGVVCEDYTHWLPGKAQGTVGYHTGERTFWSTDAEETLRKNPTRGPAASRRGDVIRCTVMFADEKEKYGKVQVPVVFTVNGSRIMPEGDQIYIEYSPGRPLYPQIGFHYENNVLAKMCPREDVDYTDLQMQELKCNLSAVKSDLAEVKAELADVSKYLISTKEDAFRHEVKSDLAVVREELSLKEVKCELESKLGEVKSELADIYQHLISTKEDVVRQEVKSELAGVREDLQQEEVKSELAEMKSELSKVKRSLEERLDAVLAKL